MPDPREITSLKVLEDLHTCPACGYDRGFHVSFISAGAGKDTTPVRSTREVCRVILICPECGARYDAGWRASFYETESWFVNAADTPSPCVPHGSPEACLPAPPRHDRKTPE
ncbi:MAG: hypothetical protein LUQ19_00415 [Methanoregula sp.]|nr:hypothetical protein [Methanoregula sp.]